MGFSKALGAAALLYSNVASATVTSTGFTVELGDVSYFLPPKAVTAIDVTKYKHLFGTGSFVPFTVIECTECHEKEISSAVEKYLQKDDVFQSGFLQAIYVQGQPKSPSYHAYNTSATTITGEAKLAPGPYFLNALGQIHEAWRLYSDYTGAFTESCISTGDGTFSVLPAGIVGQKSAIAVPSRLYYQQTEEKPLAGVRIGIKDIYDIKGLRTSNGNRAWYWLYPPAENTATPVQRLIDAGAIIVGKMITSQFANGEVATADWVDYHEAFNPRGDGYQDTSSSSSGGGAGIAAYDWLDVALGSDTGGSVRGPSQVQGLYGNRPSHGLVSLEHTMPLSPTLDTAGLLARNPLTWKAAAEVMYKGNITTTTTYPSKINTISWPTSANTIANTLLLNFLTNITTLLNATTSPINMTSTWISQNPTLPAFETLLNTTYTTLITQEQIPLVRDPFYADYAAKHDGRRPFVNPVPLIRWGWGESNNRTFTLAQAHTNKTLYMSWLNSTILAPNTRTCSESLLLYVGSDASSTTYRNAYRLSAPRPPLGFSRGYMSVMSETPDFVVPIGEAPYNSSVTGHVEYLPVTVNFMAAKGCDGMLFGLVERLFEVGLVKSVLAGWSGVKGGEALVLRK
ncbi:amidase signature enzyme [Periconia macrospinosa]|uniref:Amidase signature enzyme n=1 Tax=Periconia macrospinosa TaxID=97972 RepID=A0A2V1DNL7_9PLEO|nr:amidase signature enzyme [Periconia macrospinosa]